MYALNSAGWAPAAWSPEYFSETLGVDRIPNRGVNAATVPGAISGYDAMLKRFGTMGFQETFDRAAQLAEEGWGQAERRHQDMTTVLDKLRGDADSSATFLQDGEVPALYSIIRNPDLADALRLIQAEGRDAFYKGAIADAIVAKMQADGGVMTHEDLAEFESVGTRLPECHASVRASTRSGRRSPIPNWSRAGRSGRACARTARRRS